jgi:hypothetical protein
VKLFGLEVEDLMAISFVAIFFFITGQLAFPKTLVFRLPLNWVLFLGTMIGGTMFMGAFKYGKPRGYLMDRVTWLFSPKRRDCMAHDYEMAKPYLIDDDEEPKKSGVKSGK